MWEAMAKMSAWRFILLLVLALLVFLTFASLISDGSISDQVLNDLLKFFSGIFLGGTGGYAAGARVRKGAPKKWTGKERRKHHA